MTYRNQIWGMIKVSNLNLFKSFNQLNTLATKFFTMTLKFLRTLRMKHSKQLKIYTKTINLIKPINIEVVTI